MFLGPGNDQHVAILRNRAVKRDHPCPAFDIIFRQKLRKDLQAVVLAAVDIILTVTGKKIHAPHPAGDLQDRVSQLLFGQRSVGKINVLAAAGGLNNGLLFLSADDVAELRGVADVNERIKDSRFDFVF